MSLAERSVSTAIPSSERIHGENPRRYIRKQQWEVVLDDDFEAELLALPGQVRSGIAAAASLLQAFGPSLGRPRIDTLKGSRHANVKELRFNPEDGAWRVAFAFDLKRRAVLLVAGDKSGGSQARFYRELTRIADNRFDAHLARLERKGD